MVELDEGTLALSYIRHQASKSLAGLRVLAERTTADCGRCLEGISEEQARFKPGNEWSVKEVLDHLIYATAQAVIEPIRDLGGGKTPRPFTSDNSGGSGAAVDPRAATGDGSTFGRDRHVSRLSAGRRHAARDLGAAFPRPPEPQRADRPPSSARHGPCPADREDQGRAWLPTEVTRGSSVHQPPQ